MKKKWKEYILPIIALLLLAMATGSFAILHAMSSPVTSSFKGGAYQYELVLDANGGELSNNKLEQENTGESHEFDVSEKIPLRVGYEFIGWADSETATSPVYIDTVTVGCTPGVGSASKTVYAVWKEKEPQLVDGNQFKTAITGCTEIVFGDKQTYEAEVANIEGRSMDACGRDVYMLYRVGTTAYVLTNTPDVKIYANEDSSYMFSDMTDLRSIHFGDNFDTSRVTNMQGMFKSSTALTSLDVSKFDTSNVTNFCLMFAYLQLDKIDGVENFVTAEATNIEDMFAYCSKITSLDLSNYETSKVWNMHGMFTGCTSLKTVDISKFDTRKVERIQAMFSGCRLLETIYVCLLYTSDAADD